MNSKYRWAKWTQYMSWLFLPFGFLWAQFAVANDYTFELIAIGFFAIFLIFIPTFVVPFFLKCAGCGVSYFYNDKPAIRDFSGVDLLRPIRSQCQKCGALRS